MTEEESELMERQEYHKNCTIHVSFEQEEAEIEDRDKNGQLNTERYRVPFNQLFTECNSCGDKTTFADAFKIEDIQDNRFQGYFDYGDYTERNIDIGLDEQDLHYWNPTELKIYCSETCATAGSL